MRRARNTLIGLAVGDALGMPTQTLSRTEIAERYGTIDGLLDAGADQPISANMPAGAITDDTEQALLVAHALVEGNGNIDPLALAHALQVWEEDMRKRGSLDLLGPSSKAAIEAIAAGVPISESGKRGTTNGAAMRIAPVGIALPPAPANQLLDAVVAASAPTHNTGLALSAAALVAGTVSAGIEGADFDAALEFGLQLAESALDLGFWAAGASVPAKTRWALATSHDLGADAFIDFLTQVIGTSVSSQESVVAAALLAHRFTHPYTALRTAASLGGDTDTIAAIAGAMLGATSEREIAPEPVIAQVLEVSHLDLDPLIQALLSLRHRFRAAQ